MHVSISSISSHLSDGICQGLDDLFVRSCNNALPVDFNDAVPNTNSSSLCYTATHQTADLRMAKTAVTLYSYLGYDTLKMCT